MSSFLEKINKLRNNKLCLKLNVYFLYSCSEYRYLNVIETSRIK